MFLSPADLETLTGYVRAADQIRWLREHGILFWVSAKGKPVVARETLTGREQVATLGAIP